jgi:lipopolysaccharide biosynthesis regulator YciM
VGRSNIHRAKACDLSMEFDYQWLLVALPVAFALGWIASRFDLRQLGRDGREAPKAYFKGLNLLLSDQPDKAIDAFIEAVQHDPDTAELHFGLGNLFRRRGEFERAVRVHQHLLDRADLSPADRHRAQYALASDFMKAGLFDRAEAAYRELQGSEFDDDARLALLSLLERARDWPAAIAVAEELERRGSGSFATRIAHHACEMALEADARHDIAATDQALRRAIEVAPQAMRPLLLTGQLLARRGEHQQALQRWNELLIRQSAAWPLLAADYARSAAACGRAELARGSIEQAYETLPDLDLLMALTDLEKDAAARTKRILEHLRLQSGLGAAAKVLEIPVDEWTAQTPTRLHDVVAAAAKPLQRYRCAACGFEAHHYFWQCPACQGWDTYPPRRLEAL